MEKLNMLFTIISIVPSLLYFGFLFPHVKAGPWMKTSEIYNCSTVSNGTYVVSDDDDFYYANGDCKMPLQLGALLSFALWLWSGMV
jgi:hypothetical protein